MAVRDKAVSQGLPEHGLGVGICLYVATLHFRYVGIIPTDKDRLGPHYRLVNIFVGINPTNRYTAA